MSESDRVDEEHPVVELAEIVERTKRFALARRREYPYRPSSSFWDEMLVLRIERLGTILDKQRIEFVQMRRLAARCYAAGHREGWQEGETAQDVFDSINAVMTNSLGVDWMEKVLPEVSDV